MLKQDGWNVKLEGNKFVCHEHLPLFAKSKWKYDFRLNMWSHSAVYPANALIPTWAMSSLPGQLWSLNQLKKLWYPPRVDRIRSPEPVRLCPRCHWMGLDMDTGEPETWPHPGSWVWNSSTGIDLYSLALRIVEGLTLLLLSIYEHIWANAL